MFKKFNNTRLIILLLILAGALLLGKYFRNSKTEKTFRTELITIDTAKISSIILSPKSEKDGEIKFTKLGNEWKVQKGNIIAETQKGIVENFLGQLTLIKSQRLAARTKDKWAEYEVTDTSGTRLKIYEGNQLTADLLIGKFSYQQSNNPYGGGFGGGRGVSFTNYIRLSNEEEIYAVEGLMPFTFNQPFNQWRNQTFLKTNKDDVTKLSFKYFSENFEISKKDSLWMLDGMKPDSVKFTQYLQSIVSQNNSSFIDNFIPPSSPDCILNIDGNNMSSVKIEAFINDNEIVLYSNLNPNAYFKSDTAGLFKNIFKEKNYFLMQKKK